MTEKDKIKIIKIYLLADLIDSYLIEVQPYTSFKFKKDINILIKKSKNLIKFVDANLDENDQLRFGALADKFKIEFDKLFT